MVERRSFLTSLLAFLGFGAGARAQAPEQPVTAPAKLFWRIFRHDGQDWREVAWEAMCPGDQVVAVGLHPGRYRGDSGLELQVECWQLIADGPFLRAGEFTTAPSDTVGIEHKWDLLPYPPVVPDADGAKRLEQRAYAHDLIGRTTLANKKTELKGV